MSGNCKQQLYVPRLTKLKSGTEYWLLAESDRMNGVLCKLSVVIGRGEYLWQQVEPAPCFGLWLATTHNEARSNTAQIRTVKEFPFVLGALRRSQREADIRVLRALSQMGIQSLYSLQRTAGLGSFKRTKNAVTRLQEANSVAINREGKVGLRLPTAAEIDRAVERSPFVRTSKRAQVMADQQAIIVILAEISVIAIKYRRRTSLTELAGRLSISKSRLRELLFECEIRELVFRAESGRWRYGLLS